MKNLMPLFLMSMILALNPAFAAKAEDESEFYEDHLISVSIPESLSPWQCHESEADGPYKCELNVCKVVTQTRHIRSARRCTYEGTSEALGTTFKNYKCKFLSELEETAC